MKTILLAAGEGNRMSLTSQYGSKVLLPVPHPFIHNVKVSLLYRLILQISHSAPPSEIIIVVGHSKRKVVLNIMDNWVPDNFPVKTVTNPKYATDTNVFSAALGVAAVGEDDYVIIESDTIVENSVMDIIYNKQAGKSVLYSHDKFTPEMYGGISFAEAGKIVDAKIVKKYEDKYKNYRKLLGVTKISVGDSKNTLDFMKKDIDNGTDQYYWLSWFNRLDKLNLFEGDLSNYKTASFNTAEDYYKALNMFERGI
jgi:choline kinase